MPMRLGPGLGGSPSAHKQHILHAEPFAFLNAKRFWLRHGKTLTLWIP